mgnify:CR=1 FL=1
MPSEEEYEEAVRNLERVSWRVNCVLTHCVAAAHLLLLWEIFGVKPLEAAMGVAGNIDHAVSLQRRPRLPGL